MIVIVHVIVRVYECVLAIVVILRTKIHYNGRMRLVERQNIPLLFHTATSDT